MILVSPIEFSGMPGLVMWPQNTLHIALWVKHLRLPPFGQGQALNWYNFPQNRSRCIIVVFTIGFSDMPDPIEWTEMKLHCG